MQHSKSFYLAILSLYINFVVSINDVNTCVSLDFECVSTSEFHKTAKVYDSQDNPSECIKTCSRESPIRVLSIEFHSRISYVDTVIDIGDNVRDLSIKNKQTDCIRVRVKRRHPSIEKISTDNCIYFNQGDQFLSYKYFPNLAILRLEFPKFDSIPPLAEFPMLAQANIRNIILPSPVVFDATTFNGLSRLSQLVWVMHYPNGISFTKDCFTNLPSLTQLDIVGQIERVHNYQFITLTQLMALGLEGSNPLATEEHSFDGLNQITRLSFWNSQGINRDILRTRRFPKLRGVAIYNNGLTTLDNVFYQQQPVLDTIVATSNPFHCDCNLQWVALPFIKNNIMISGTCSTPSNLTGFNITNAANYQHCSQDLSYQCFNRSFNCPKNSVCFNTRNNAFCRCNLGFSLSHVDNTCRYVNACQTDNGGCEQDCMNTTHDLYCGCRDGYSLANDKHSCPDVDECLALSADDCHNCTNTIGSYQCTCNSGYLYSTVSRACRDLDECRNDSDNSCHQLCTNTIGSYSCSCYEGYRLVGTACVDVDECQVVRCEQKCVNTVGSYMCACNDNFVYSNRTDSCVSLSVMMISSSVQTIIPISIFGFLISVVVLILILAVILLSVKLYLRQNKFQTAKETHYENNSKTRKEEMDFEVGLNPLYAEITVNLETSTLSKRELPSLPINKGGSSYEDEKMVSESGGSMKEITTPSLH